MAKRAKRLKKGIESLKEEIENHFVKIEEDAKNENTEMRRYHIKEIDKSLLKTLETKIHALSTDDDSAREYRKRLEELKRREGII
ncbi:hypothetical protein CO038_03300 [Candidatus Pacearchaeota archaeon CG_4_9_14_0_2_um_filter_39_13]|nr:MAG: hypothetical protein CO038_03300 [Candidatus Pacearchaeota archaeon CG_4_9_14_0_2_um_filter_39_13]